MSEAYHIVSDGSCDLPPALVREIGVTVVPFYVSFGDENYQKEIEEIGIREFYQKMVDNPKIYPKSSMPSVQDYVEVFEPLVREGKPVICICITTKFSGSMQSALNARQMLLEEYPEAEITVMDATVNTVLQGLLVLEAVRLRDRGTSPYLSDRSHHRSAHGAVSHRYRHTPQGFLICTGMEKLFDMGKSEAWRKGRIF